MEKMRGKIWSYVLVSGESPAKYRKAFWELHEYVCMFIKALPLHGPWFVAYKPGNLEEKRKEVETKLINFLDKLLTLK